MTRGLSRIFVWDSILDNEKKTLVLCRNCLVWKPNQEISEIFSWTDWKATLNILNVSHHIFYVLIFLCFILQKIVLFFFYNKNIKILHFCCSLGNVCIRVLRWFLTFVFISIKRNNFVHLWSIIFFLVQSFSSYSCWVEMFLAPREKFLVDGLSVRQNCAVFCYRDMTQIGIWFFRGSLNSARNQVFIMR